LIELSALLSSRILRKGDVFSVYVDVRNIGKEPIHIVNVKLTSPLGFIKLSKDKMPTSIWDSIRGTRIGLTSFEFKAEQFEVRVAPFEFEISRSPVKTAATDSQKTATTTIPNSQKVTVQPNESYRAEFYLQAGRRVSLIPRPDTYTISIEVEVMYASDLTATHRKQLSTDISIFPTVAGMLGGTLVGSFLGTIIRHIESPNWQFVVPILITNLVLGFIVGVILMRKKDVQPFVTVEDFWGGILLGYLVGFGGQALFEQITGINLGGNATSTAD
jgi:hypothetical protein